MGRASYHKDIPYTSGMMEWKSRISFSSSQWSNIVETNHSNVIQWKSIMGWTFMVVPEMEMPHSLPYLGNVSHSIFSSMVQWWLLFDSHMKTFLFDCHSSRMWAILLDCEQPKPSSRTPVFHYKLRCSPWVTRTCFLNLPCASSWTLWGKRVPSPNLICCGGLRLICLCDRIARIDCSSLLHSLFFIYFCICRCCCYWESLFGRHPSSWALGFQLLFCSFVYVPHSTVVHVIYDDCFCSDSTEWYVDISGFILLARAVGLFWSLLIRLTAICM